MDLVQDALGAGAARCGSLPTANVSPEELGSRLLVAGLLECRDAGQLRLRLADNRDWRPGTIDPEPSRVWVMPLASARVPGLCHLQAQATPWWRPAPEVQRFVGDCEQIRTLAQACAQAADHWSCLIMCASGDPDRSFRVTRAAATQDSVTLLRGRSGHRGTTVHDRAARPH